MSNEDEMPESDEGGEDYRLSAFEQVIDWFIQSDPGDIKRYVDALRVQNPGISDDALAGKIVKRKSFKNGLVGAALGIPGFLALPVTIPADLAVSWKIQITMALSIAYVYGHTDRTTDLKTDIYLILAGDAAKEGLKHIGVEVGKEVTKRAVQKYMTRSVMSKIWKVVGRKIITRGGERSLVSLVKIVPLVGAPIGFGFDWAATRIVGRNARHYYSGRG